LISESGFAGEYSDCILENMKGVNDRFAASHIKIACREKALPYVPAKCKKPIQIQANFFDQFDTKPKWDELSPVDPFSAIATDSCINNCLNASYWSKHFGDCKE
jgi:hypothetical protein